MWRPIADIDDVRLLGSNANEWTPMPAEAAQRRRCLRVRGRALRPGRVRAPRQAAAAAAPPKLKYSDNPGREEQHDRAVPPASPSCPPPRFLDQRLDQRFQLGAIDRLGRAAGLESGGRGGAVTAMTTSDDDATMTSTMLGVKVDRDEPLELHEQVAGEIRRAIADGEAKPGERLPPAKDLAAVLGVNTNTVLRALRQLRDEGLLEFRRGRGITVTGTPEHGAVIEQARELLHFARTQATSPTS